MREPGSEKEYLESYDQEQFKKMSVATDLLILTIIDDQLTVLMTKRSEYPFKGCWALPGGFMEMDETLEHCAVRELEEETGLKVSEQEIRLIGVYSALGRDPRGRTVTAAYAAHVENDEAVAGDDAAEVRWWPIAALPPLAFDHADIVSDGQRL